MTKKILGLDLGTNSIGWALIEQDFEKKYGKIVGMGSRIIPMSQDILNTYGDGGKVSQTAERTNYRSIRRLRERHLLRRERLHRILNIMGFLPEHYAQQIDFKERLGKIFTDKEPKLAYNNANQFIFKKSFEEMLADFKENQPQILTNHKGESKLIPYNWTIYYLRKKALAEKIEKEELAWLILNFNQKRGYYQLRGEEGEENPSKLVEFHSLRIMDVIADENHTNNEVWYSLILENGWTYRRSSKTPLYDWKDKTRDFIVTTDLNDDNSIKTDKQGTEKRRISLPDENDWTLIKKKTEQNITTSQKTVGTYIYDSLLMAPSQKIRGKLVRTIERKFYKDELLLILEAQKQFHAELKDVTLYNDCVRELYRNNDVQREILSKKDFTHLFVEDIIFYQRPLKSQKSSIGNCSFEYRKYKDSEGKEHIEFLKAIPKSHPLYQEFRVWQWLFNLKIYRKDNDSDVTNNFIKNIQDKQNLFKFLMNQKEVNHKDILTYFILPAIKEKFPNAKPVALNREINKEISKYRWNYVFDDSKDKEDEKSRAYPMNETGYEIRKRLDKTENVPANFLTSEKEHRLWHIIYSVTDKEDFEKALKSYAIKNHLDDDSFVYAFKKFPPFRSEYGSFSEKAIKKILPLMRLGNYWEWGAIDKKTKERILKIITGEYDEDIKERVREKSIHLLDQNDFQGLQTWLASYIIYGRHSEAKDAGKWHTVDELKSYLNEFKQHSLRNPIVEQVITETLRVVADIWKQYGAGTKDFFDEIHIELSREIKNSAEERKQATNRIMENENTNIRIKALLTEMLSDRNAENVRPYSPMQQEALRIYEDGVMNSNIEIPDDIAKISKTAQPTKAELTRYKLWIEQKYRSPYTGSIIPLNKLFAPQYEIEHIIPQSRFFDDSFSNKVICESAVNKLKNNQVGFEFIKNHHGETVELGDGNRTRILNEDEYKDFVNQHYAKSRVKRNKLLLEDIPEKMVERQLNDTRYISKYISSILSNIVRSDINDDGLNSKNLIPGNGKITNILKQDWGLNDVWNDLIVPRFERMNVITGSAFFTAYNEKYQKYLPTVPIEFSKNFQKKRIDHRHHAMDALVIACATRDHINLLNNQHAKSANKRYDLQRKLRMFEKVQYKDINTNELVEKDVAKDFLKPWQSFTIDAKNKLQEVIVSFKQNLRIINRTTNTYEKWVDRNGSKIKEHVRQIKGDSWAIRKPLHKETVSGKITLKDIKIPKGKLLTATRKSINASFNIHTIESITDTGIQKILKNYLASKGNDSSLAFSPEGIEDMNRNIEKYNNGKYHQPINKVRIFEPGSKFPLGQSGNKKAKYVEAAKGTNLFFAVYQDENGNRNYETLPLNEVIEHLKWRALLSTHERQNTPIIPVKPERGTLLFSLSPNDLVYIPTEEERENINGIDWKELTREQIKNIYKVVSFSGYQIFFVRHEIATSIVNKAEFSSLNKMERTIDGKMIKESCIKIKIGRLGNVLKP